MFPDHNEITNVLSKFKTEFLVGGITGLNNLQKIWSYDIKDTVPDYQEIENKKNNNWKDFHTNQVNILTEFLNTYDVNYLIPTIDFDLFLTFNSKKIPKQESNLFDTILDNRVKNLVKQIWEDIDTEKEEPFNTFWKNVIDIPVEKINLVDADENKNYIPVVITTDEYCNVELPRSINDPCNKILMDLLEIVGSIGHDDIVFYLDWDSDRNMLWKNYLVNTYGNEIKNYESFIIQGD